MPEITLPEVRLPDVRLPEGLREMNRKDIQNALNERMPKKIELPDVDLSKVEAPKIDLSKIDLSKVELPKAVEERLPKAVEERLPNRSRTNPFLPLAAFAAVMAAIAAAWWLITSPTAATRVRETADRTWRKVTGQQTDVVRYDDDDDLRSLLPNPDQTRPATEQETWPDTFSELGESVRADTASTTDEPTGV
ncbi:MAG TPA: hypothetical protein VH440_12020 [Candidatus Limnocylindrales bacterium]|jgi:hypothetical protein